MDGYDQFERERWEDEGGPAPRDRDDPGKIVFRF